MKLKTYSRPLTDIVYGMIWLLLGLSLCLFCGEVFASGKYSGKVGDILRLKITPQEKADSVFTFLHHRTGDVQDSLHYAECEKAIREVLIPYAQEKGFEDSLMALIYDELGMMSNRQGPGRIVQTREAYEKGLDYARSASDSFREGLILEHNANAETRFGNIADGYRLSEEAIGAYDKCGPEAEQRVTRCYYTQAVTYLNVMDLEGMLKVIDNLKKFAGKVSEDNRSYVLYNIYSVQEAYYGTLLQTDKAIDLHAVIDTLNNVSLASTRLIDDNYDYWRSTSIDPTWNYYNRAVFFLEYVKPIKVDSIEYYLDKALAVDLSGKGHVKTEAIVSVASLRAEMWMDLGNYAKAKDILEETIALLDKEEGVNNLILDKIEIYKNLLEISKQSGRYEEALAYASQISELEKERFSEERAKDIKELEIKYETQETQLALVKSEKRRASTLMWLFAAIGLLLIGVIAFIVYAESQRRRRLKKEVEFTKLRSDIGRQLTQQYVEGLENERKRMARELHDGVCNDLLAIEMGIKEGKPKENTAELLNECRESVRRISHELMPPEFAYASLDEVVRYFVMKQSDAYVGKIAIHYFSSAEGREWGEVPDSVSLEIYRIVQEALGNAVKHSGCNAIDLSMTLKNDEFTLKVADNGLFKLTRDKGFGLQSIRKRAEAIGAQIRIDHQESQDATETTQGTTLSLKLKLKGV